jgi:hypothetical protein
MDQCRHNLDKEVLLVLPEVSLVLPEVSLVLPEVLLVLPEVSLVLPEVLLVRCKWRPNQVQYIVRLLYSHFRQAKLEAHCNTCIHRVRQVELPLVRLE